MNSKNLFLGTLPLEYNDFCKINIKQLQSVFEIAKDGKLVFNGKYHIGTGCNISNVSNGQLEFGVGFNCSVRRVFIAHKIINLEKQCLLFCGCTFIDTDFHKIKKNEFFINEASDIRIKKNSWIGCNCNILKGNELPAGSALVTGSILNKKHKEENFIYDVVPAKFVFKIFEWES